MAPGMIYLDNAATSWPKPESVYQAIDKFGRTSAGNPGRSGHRMSVEAERVVVEARLRLARLVHAESPERIVFTLNGTDALNMAIKGLGLKAGDHVVTSELEHNSINRPLGRLRTRGVEISKATAVEPEEIRKLIGPRTRLMALTHCSNVTGVVSPIHACAEIARKHGIPLLVDAAQSVGVMDLDVRGLDLVAFPGHKGLFGPMGTGALYVRPGLELEFAREGGTGLASEVELQPEAMPQRLEAGTPNAVGLAGLAAGLEFVETTTPARIGEHERRLAQSFVEQIRDMSEIRIFSGQVGVISVAVEEPQEAAAVLDQSFGIACRAGLHCAPGTHRQLGTFPQGTLRFSFGYFNTDADVRAAADALRAVAKSV